MKPSFLTLGLSVGLCVGSVAAFDYTTPLMLTQANRCGHVTENVPCSRHARSGAGGFTPIFTFVDDDLLKKVQGIESDLKDRTFSFDNNAIIMLGGMGYHTNPAGMRVGAGAWIGYKQFTSDEFEHTDTVYANPITYQANMILRTIPMHVGMIVEKAFFLGPVNVFAGGYLGTGVLVLHKQLVHANNVFTDDNSEMHDRDSLDWSDSHNAVACAPQVVGDVHAGTTIALSPTVQVGLEGVLAVASAPDGFVTGRGFGDFYSVTPGVRLRVMFGRE